MTKAEELSKLIGLSVEMIENEIDKGMYDILIELNRKNYKTIFCCEGHLTDHDKYGKDYWNGYIAFADTYNFPQFPKNFYKVSHKRMYFYWHGNGEESRQKYLSDLYDWACCLPTRPKKKVVTYHFMAKHKNQPNRDKLLAFTTDYEEIRCILNREDMDKYFDFDLHETVSYI